MKEIIKEVYWEKRYEGIVDSIPFGHLPVGLLSTDELIFVFDEGYYSENNSWDAFSELRILRSRLETDEEEEKRQEKEEKEKNRRKENRRQRYLQLKKEFEG